MILSEPDVLGTLGSNSTRRKGIMTLGDVTTTVLNRLDRARPSGLGGSVARLDSGTPDIGALVDLDRRVDQRERSYAPTVTIFIVIQALAYIIAPLVARWSSVFLPAVVGASGGHVGVGGLPGADVPLAPGAGAAGSVGDDPGALHAVRRCGHGGDARPGFGLSPLNTVAGVTLAVMVVDASLGAPLQQISLLGDLPVTAARFYGIGNMAFAVLGACAVIVAASWLHAATDRRAAFVAVAGLFALAIVVDAGPMLGADFGGCRP